MKASTYLAVDVAGGLIPQDVLSRIGAADRELPGMRPEDYRLAETERLGDAASRHWEYLLGAYRAYRDRTGRLPAGDTGTSLTRERWLQVLFGELGFGHVPFNRGALQAGGKEFPVSHLWHSVPMHLLGWNVELDKATPDMAGAKRAPQSMLQEFLNLSDDHLWGVLSNGRRLRILRDSTALVGSAYVEFDLEAIFDGELYSEFVLLYTLLHASRFELISDEGSVPTCADCWLEKWRAFAAQTGVQAREQLRYGVEKALEALGTGFLVANPRLREQLSAGKLSRKDFHHELLRLAYQLIFIFVAEDRGALLDPAATQVAKDRYDGYFSTRRLRRLAIRRSGDRHPDLWRTIVKVISALGDEEGLPALGLPGLGGIFFRTAEALTELTDAPKPDQFLVCDLPNEALLTAVRWMSTIRGKDGRPRDVDFQHLGAEELGSVYESLLELDPYPDLAVPQYELKTVAGNDRKTTGSYYTPSSLIESLLDTALDPVIDEHAKSGIADDLLNMTVCDPACGSGHFLVAAARRIAKRYAAMVTGEDEPVPSAVREAMRKVVGKCIYGVDLNPLAAELAKVSLWIESLEPGKPLAFLDAHIKVGNALLGTTPRLIAAGIPDGAFKPIEGDDKSVTSALKKQNAREVQFGSREPGSALRGEQESLFDEAELPDNQKLAEQARALATLPVSSVADVREQQRRFHELESSEELTRARRVAHAWCAAFVWRKHAEAPEAITSATIRSLEGGASLAPERAEELRRLTEQYRFFHWHLEFPEIFRVGRSGHNINLATGWEGGFTCILGNPPWEHIELKEQEFFASRAPEIAEAAGAKRKKLIANLAERVATKPIFDDYVTEKRWIDGVRHFAANSGVYPLTGRGRVKTDPLFVEGSRERIDPRGRIGIIVPTGIATDATTQFFFNDLVEKGALVSLYDFENREKIFLEIDSRIKFCLLTIAGSNRNVDRADFAFFVHGASQLLDEGKRFTLTPEEIKLLNPNTGTCPIFRTRRDAEITLGIYRRVPVLLREGDRNGNPWGISFMQGLFNMTSDSDLFRPSAADGETLEFMESEGWQLDGNILVNGEERLLPLYEAKMLHHYDHRWATYESDGSTRDVTLIEKRSADAVALPRYWVPESEVDKKLREKGWKHDWLVGFRKICRSTDERTIIAFSFPKGGMGDSGNLLLSSRGAPQIVSSLAVSLALDYVLRQKLGGTNLNFFQFEQLPFPAPEVFEARCAWDERTIGAWIILRVIELAYTGRDMKEYAWDLHDGGEPFVWNEARRTLLRAELDAAFFHLYGIDRDDVDYIMDTFPIVRRKDEAKYGGEYRTKRLILEIYDAMQDAIDGHKPYQTRLDPPPGQGPRHPARSL
ncbi:Eco57I restriction-modification methylase domain-containing protein [Sphaerisporangium perillae]|uniref:Eco57I restriction-modification methylase domain-containing protein n=1 Tax=Sphaerisporangium perillae TaxID=2935860 RepID=UPI00200C1BDF|nr:N-6 DNA methylase [Sphaerisporangium perillae]